MFVALMKLVALAAAMLGPFTVGAAAGVVSDPEAFGFFIVAGIGIGLCGVFGFAALDRGELGRHVRKVHGIEG